MHREGPPCGSRPLAYRSHLPLGVMRCAAEASGRKRDGRLQLPALIRLQASVLVRWPGRNEI